MSRLILPPKVDVAVVDIELELIDPQVILRVPALIEPQVKEFVPQVNAPLEVIAPEVKLLVPQVNAPLEVIAPEVKLLVPQDSVPKTVTGT